MHRVTQYKKADKLKHRKYNLLFYVMLNNEQFSVGTYLTNRCNTVACSKTSYHLLSRSYHSTDICCAQSMNHFTTSYSNGPELDWIELRTEPTNRQRRVGTIVSHYGACSCKTPRQRVARCAVLYEVVSCRDGRGLRATAANFVREKFPTNVAIVPRNGRQTSFTSEEFT